MARVSRSAFCTYYLREAASPDLVEALSQFQLWVRSKIDSSNDEGSTVCWAPIGHPAHPPFGFAWACFDGKKAASGPCRRICHERKLTVYLLERNNCG